MPGFSSREPRAGRAPSRHSGVRLLEADEAAQLVETLALAFRDNPLNRAAIRGQATRRLRSNRYGMRATLAAAQDRSTILVPDRSLANLAGPALGGLIALAPGAWPLPPPPLLAQFELWLGQGIGTLRRWGHVYEQLAELHPLGPHWYLQLLGVDSGVRRAGIGSSLLRAWLEVVDADGVPAYLETDRQENIAFYGQHGFEVVGTHAILKTPIWRMRRPGSTPPT